LGVSIRPIGVVSCAEAKAEMIRARENRTELDLNVLSFYIESFIVGSSG
jgi:hypothetical protein